MTAPPPPGIITLLKNTCVYCDKTWVCPPQTTDDTIRSTSMVTLVLLLATATLAVYQPGHYCLCLCLCLCLFVSNRLNKTSHLVQYYVYDGIKCVIIFTDQFIFNPLRVESGIQMSKGKIIVPSFFQFTMRKSLHIYITKALHIMYSKQQGTQKLGLMLIFILFDNIIKFIEI